MKNNTLVATAASNNARSCLQSV